MGMFKHAVKPGLFIGIGAAIGYFCDPQNGRRRRAVARDRFESKRRKFSEEAQTRARYAEGVAQGVQARMEGKGQFHPVGDRSVADHLHQVIAALPFDTSRVEIDVTEGVVGLRGQVDAPEEIDATQQAVALAPGVVTVHSWLHLPGTIAPNKADALTASARRPE